MGREARRARRRRPPRRTSTPRASRPRTRRSSEVRTATAYLHATRSRSSRARPADMCGIAGIVRPDGARPVEEIALRRMARAVRHRGPDGFGLASVRAPVRVHPSGHLRHPHGWQPMQSDAGGTSSSTTARSSTTRAARRACTRGSNLETTSDTEVVLRLLERDGLAALDTAERPVRVRLVGAGPAPADAGPRPLRHPAAALDAARRRQDRLRLGGKALFASGEVGRAATSAASTTSSRRGPRAPRARRSAA